jgi:hypothetical protein
VLVEERWWKALRNSVPYTVQRFEVVKSQALYPVYGRSR